MQSSWPYRSPWLTYESNSVVESSDSHAAPVASQRHNHQCAFVSKLFSSSSLLHMNVIASAPSTHSSIATVPAQSILPGSSFLITSIICQSVICPTFSEVAKHDSPSSPNIYCTMQISGASIICELHFPILAGSSSVAKEPRQVLVEPVSEME